MLHLYIPDNLGRFGKHNKCCRICGRCDIIISAKELKYSFSEPVLLKVYPWRLADRVSLEMAVPPVFGKENLLWF